MQLNVALTDGFDGDEVSIRVGEDEVFRDRVTTRTQISHAADMQLGVPDGPFTLGVEVPTRGVQETFAVDPRAQPNVAISLIEGRLVAAYPERLGFA